MKEYNYKKITQLMKQARKEYNYTQEQVAKDLNCTPAFISNVENNRAKLNLRILSYYSHAFKVPLESFLDPHPVETQRDYVVLHFDKEEELNKELLDVFKSYSIEERKKIIEIIKYWNSDSSKPL